MKVWHMTCDVCKRPGPNRENPIEAIRLAEDQGWGRIDMGIILLTSVCPECCAEPERSFEFWRTGRRPQSVVLQPALL